MFNFFLKIFCRISQQYPTPYTLINYTKRRKNEKIQMKNSSGSFQIQAWNYNTFKWVQAHARKTSPFTGE